MEALGSTKIQLASAFAMGGTVAAWAWVKKIKEQLR